MEDQLGALGLVLNCVVLWNTFYTDRAITALRDDGQVVNDNDIARLSAYIPQTRQRSRHLLLRPTSRPQPAPTTKTTTNQTAHTDGQA